MSVHPLPVPAGDLEDSIRWQQAAELQRMALRYFGREPTITDDGTRLSLVFTPDLTAPQVTTLGRLIKITGFMRISPAEWAAVEPDIATCVSFLGIANPTSTQNATALKALIRIVRAMTIETGGAEE